jgi:hypothetical protein
MTDDPCRPAVRTLTLGLPFQFRVVPILLGWLFVLVLLGRHSMTRRLVK